MANSWNPSDMPPTSQVPPVPPPGAPGTPFPPVPPPGAPGAPVPPGAPAPKRPMSPIAIVAITLGAGVLVVALVAGAFALGRGGDDDAAPTTTASTTSTTVAPTTAAPTTAAPTTPPAPVTTIVGDVRDQPDGLLCRDLRAKGFSYSAAVDYWRMHGQPNRLDVEKDGIPCETVYPTGDVLAYWGTLGVTPTLRSTSIFDQPPGLLCRDLKAQGFDVYDAIAYYLNWGEPSNMDADGNGVPCETVFPDAYDVWTGGFGE